MTMSESVAELRGAPRAAVRLPFQVKSATTGEFSPYFCGDISETGLFLESDTPPKRGTLLRLEWTTGDEIVEGVGRVVWARHRDDASDAQPPGAGVKFVKLSAESLRVVKALTDVSAPLPTPRATFEDDQHSGTHATLDRLDTGEASNDTAAAKPEKIAQAAPVETAPVVEAAPVIEAAPVVEAPAQKSTQEKSNRRGTRSKAERKAAARAKRDSKRRRGRAETADAPRKQTQRKADAAAADPAGTTFSDDPVGGRAMRHRGTPVPDAPRLTEVENTSPGLISSDQARAMLRKERDAARHTNRLALYGVLTVAGILVAYLLSTVISG